MSSIGLINVSGVKSMLSIPAHIFDDERATLGAKGLFAQICYSKDNIMSIEDISKLANEDIDTSTKYINELVDLGYLVAEKSGRFSLKHKAASAKVVSKQDTEAIKSSIKSTTIEPPVKKNKFEFVRDRVMDTDLPQSVKELLVDYFHRWLKGEDRFANSELHKNMIDSKIKAFIELKDSMALNQKEMEQCVKQSIDNHWYRFFWPLINKPSTGSSQFDRSALVSGSYSPEEIEEIKRKAQQRLEATSDE